MEGLGLARNVNIKKFADEDKYTTWKNENPLYFIYDIQIVKTSQYDYRVFVIYQTVNEVK